MAPLTEFTLFQDLPVEIRVKIWELVPQPQRLIGLLPCPHCWEDFWDDRLKAVINGDNNNEDEDGFEGDDDEGSIEAGDETGDQDDDNENGNEDGDEADDESGDGHGSEHSEDDWQPPPMRPRTFLQPDHEPHPKWSVRLVVQPRDQAILPTFHACRESRDVMLMKGATLPHYFPMPNSQHIVRSDVPYVSFETDIFTYFSTWMYKGVYGFTDNIELFPGIDHTRIQHFGVAAHVLHAHKPPVTYLRDGHFNNLQTVSLLGIGPTPQAVRVDGQPRHLETQDLELTVINAAIRDIPPTILRRQLFFDHSKGVFSREVLSPVYMYMQFLKACLWHGQHVDAAELTPISQFHFVDNLAFDSWDFMEYLLYEDTLVCPLKSAICGEGGHTKEEMLEGPTGVQVNYKLVCEEGWMKVLEDTGLFDLESSDSNEMIIERVKATVASRAGWFEGEYRYFYLGVDDDPESTAMTRAW